MPGPHRDHRDHSPQLGEPSLSLGAPIAVQMTGW